ncbi:hypothetical protein ACF3DV_14540 [Chlorogloeopsis fritschii PCC 9212]|uniref:hypothetical protein n=1 Tax=Chlorogloeopsis fritschii TaxID=1124 RepID=UPI00190F8807|nr:hypothetical protein [Chlorogloeopsis fritschii]
MRRLPPMVRAGIAVVAVQPQRRLCPRRTCMAIRTSEGSPPVVATAQRQKDKGTRGRILP